ncbi:hypothetical protein [Streptosporangium canum]|uniref:hypothetical protein n=1 Tax=Streptosporangium canum TaxID=324952 RepID=UPI00378ED716
MTRLQGFLAAFAVMVLPSAKGRHHGSASATPVPDDAQTVTFPRLTSHPYPQEPNR